MATLNQGIDVIIVEPQNLEEMHFIKSMLDKMRVKAWVEKFYENTTTNQPKYKPEIIEAYKQMKEGNYIEITKEELQKILFEDELSV